MIKGFFVKMLPFLLAIIVIAISLLVNFKLLVNQKAVLTSLEKSNYSQQSYQKTLKTFSYYLNDELITSLVSEKEIKKDIKKYVSVFFDQTVTIHEKKLKQEKAKEIEIVITNYFAKNELGEDEAAIIKLSELLANKYVNTVFPVYELELIEIYYNPINRLLNNILIVLILLLVITINTIMVTEKKHLGRGLGYVITFLAIIGLLFFFNQSFIINQQIDDLFQVIKNQFLFNNYLFIFLLVLIISPIELNKLAKKK